MTIEDPGLYAILPSAPVVTVVWVAALTAGWVLIAYRDVRAYS